MWDEDRPPEDGEVADATECDPAEREPVELDIDGCLDLHHFAPREVKQLVPDYLDECLARGILELRIVHGKGIGTLRTIVHAILAEHPAVVWFGHRPEAGSWGATMVTLQPPPAAKDN